MELSSGILLVTWKLLPCCIPAYLRLDTLGDDFHGKYLYLLTFYTRHCIHVICIHACLFDMTSLCLPPFDLNTNSLLFT